VTRLGPDPTEQRVVTNPGASVECPLDGSGRLRDPRRFRPTPAVLRRAERLLRLLTAKERLP
jgi:hypothetical protein